MMASSVASFLLLACVLVPGTTVAMAASDTIATSLGASSDTIKASVGDARSSDLMFRVAARDTSCFYEPLKRGDAVELHYQVRWGIAIEG